MLYWRMLMSGGQTPLPLGEGRLLEIGQEARGNLRQALDLAREALDSQVEANNAQASLEALRRQMPGSNG